MKGVLVSPDDGSCQARPPNTHQDFLSHFFFTIQKETFVYFEDGEGSWTSSAERRLPPLPDDILHRIANMTEHYPSPLRVCQLVIRAFAFNSEPLDAAVVKVAVELRLSHTDEPAGTPGVAVASTGLLARAFHLMQPIHELVTTLWEGKDFELSTVAEHSELAH